MLDLGNFDTIKHIERMLEIEHISILELSFDVLHILPNAFSDSVIKKLIDLKDERGVSYTIHLPFWSIELATFNEPVRKGGVKSIVDAIKIAEPLDPEAYGRHSTGSLATEFSKLTFSPNIVQFICTAMAGFSASGVEEILSQSEIDSRKLAIENLEFPFDITRDVIDEYDTGICFDTGHLLSKQSCDESMFEFYTKHKDRIVEFHLHDGSATRTDVGSGFIDHRALGTYDLPVHDFMSELIKDDFRGPIIFELTENETRASLKHIKEVIPAALDN